MLEIEVKGFKEIDAALRNFPLRVQRNILAGAVRAATKPVVQKAQAGAPVAAKPHYFYPYRKKALRKSGRAPQGSRLSERVLIRPGLIRRMIRAWKSRSKEAAVIYHVGPRKKGGGYESDPWYAIFFELGTKKMAAKPFMKPAFDSTQKQQVSAMRDYLWKRIFKEFSKLTGGP